MATFIVSFPIVITRSVIIVTNDISGSVDKIAEAGAESTDGLPLQEKTLGFYTEPGQGLRFRYEQLETSVVSAPPPPKGTVLQ